MLSNHAAYATIAVKDLSAAKEFYEGKLGLSPNSKDLPGGVMYDCGNSQIFVYESSFAGTNQATSATWVVDDVSAEASALEEKGVVFEQYEIPGSSVEGAVHSMGDFKSAWFKDVDGNILNIASS